MHDELDRAYPLNGKGRKNFEHLMATIRENSRDKPYDCVVGISGGRDSTYTLYLLKKMGLRPLAVYFNDGFSNPVAEILSLFVSFVHSFFAYSRSLQSDVGVL